MKKTVLFLCVNLFLIIACSGNNVNSLLIIDSFLENKSLYKNSSKILILNTIDDKDGMCIELLNGVKGPVSLKNKYSDCLIFFPSGNLSVIAKYSGSARQGGYLSKKFKLENYKYYLLYPIIKGLKYWTVELREFDLNKEIIKSIKIDSKDNWKINVYNSLNRYDPLKKDPMIKLWEDVYNIDIKNAIKCFKSDELFEEIVSINSIKFRR